MVETVRQRLMVAIVVCVASLGMAASADNTPDAYSCDNVALVPANGEFVIKIGHTVSGGVKVLAYVVDFGNGTEVRVDPSTTLLYPHHGMQPGRYTLTAALVVKRSDGSRAIATNANCRVTVDIVGGRPSPSLIPS